MTYWFAIMVCMVDKMSQVFLNVTIGTYYYTIIVSEDVTGIFLSYNHNID